MPMTTTKFKPMLAETFGPARVPVGEPIFSQPKLDGVRCVATAAGLFSRTGKPITTAPHVAEGLAPIFAEEPGLVLDGELYRHELRADFGAVLSAVQKRAKVALEFHAFDLTAHRPLFLDFSERWATLRRLLRLADPACVHAVETVECRSLAELDAAYGRHMADGYEGQIVRLERPYWNGRTVALMKRKEFGDAEFTVASVDEGTGERAGLASAVTCRLPDGRTFGAGLAASREDAARILAERARYVGRLATVRYQALSPAGIPRFPVAVALHAGERP